MMMSRPHYGDRDDYASFLSTNAPPSRFAMAQQSDNFPSITEEDGSETTLSLPVQSLRLNSSETTETTFSENVTQSQLTLPDSGLSEGTFGPAGSREIHFHPRPNSSKRNSLRRPTEAGQRSEFLFLLTNDSNTSKSEDDDIHVEEEEDAHDDTEARRSLSSLYREIKFELLPQEVEGEVELISTTGDQGVESVEDDEPETADVERGNHEERTRDGDTEATEDNSSYHHHLLSDEALLLPRHIPHEDSIGSCCDDEDVHEDEVAAFSVEEHITSPSLIPSSVQTNYTEVNPSTDTGSHSIRRCTSKSSTVRNSVSCRNENNRARSRFDNGQLTSSPSNQQSQEHSASKSSSVISVSTHSTDTAPVPPRRSSHRGDSSKPILGTPLHGATNGSPPKSTGKEVALSPTLPPIPSPVGRTNRQHGLGPFSDLKSEATQIVTPSHSPVLSANVTSIPRIHRVDGEDAPEVSSKATQAASAAAVSSQMVASLQKPKNLYDELLEYHREHDESESKEQPPSGHLVPNPHRLKDRNRTPSVGSLFSSEDAKLPAHSQPLSTDETPASGHYHYHSSPFYQELVADRESEDLNRLFDSQEQLMSRRSLAHLEADEAIARMLQEELDAEQRRNEEESLRAALALQRQEEEALSAQSRQSSSNESLLPLALPDGTSMQEQQRILEQIRAQQEEKQLQQALNLSSHNLPYGEMGSVPTESIMLRNERGAQLQRSFQQCHQPRFPPPQPHAYPHRRTRSGESPDYVIPSDLSASTSSSRMSNDYHTSPPFRSHQSDGAQPVVSSSAMSEAFERQFRPRDAPRGQNSVSQQQTSLAGSFRRRPASSSGGANQTRPEWELSQQEALRQFQRQKHQREQPQLLHTRDQPSAPMIPSIPSPELDLVRRGAAETARAVQGGRAHIVQCQNCRARLQAPIQYALVYCPNCRMVSPGQSYVPTPGPASTSGASGQTGRNSAGQRNLPYPPAEGGGRRFYGDDGSSDARSWY